ncbi:MAG: dihydropteroate synthase [Prevotella shahii]|jgi:dihydropteroate synthase|uniref:dihydropteroate synthase n=1 Tax=Hoylesella shahii TaxID=228603 RepID=UPI001CB5B35C|nr:dihydropteroate synthase [Hoylesella shahii]MBF1567590.1 dihydropteroate synthase [Hoylesella shahii]MBF1589810.1 dihydropteroate synthase [Hoylesella shahii]
MSFSITVKQQLFDLSSPRVMGILNATPDSFFSGSRMQTEKEIAQRANQIVEEGGTMIDVGAFSTRPGADQVSQEEEIIRLRRALAVVRKEQPDAVISVDTFRPEVAQMCVEEYGADIINDVSDGGLTGIANVPLQPQPGELPQMFHTVARLGVPYILMSVQPTLRDVLLGFARKVSQLRTLGVKDIILDPGFGFGKSVDQNFVLLNEMEKTKVLDLPLLVGVSRKSMIFKTIGGNADTALNGTTALNAIALMKGANILRVHDVKEAVETVTLFNQTTSQTTT